MEPNEADPTICRLCLNASDINIMLVLNQNENIIKSIMQITSVEVIVDPNHIVYMCNSCQFLLDQCVQFRTTCVQNDNTFRKLYAKNSIQNIVHVDVDPIPSPEVKLEEEFDDGDNGSSPAPPTAENVEEKVEVESGAEVGEDGSSGSGSSSSSSSSEEEEARPKKRGRKPGKRGPQSKDARKEMRQVQCAQCGKMVSENNLNQHQQIHNPDRPKFQCPHCPRVCHERSRLKLHINAVHTGEVKYTCDQCGKMYTRPASLRNHYLAIHTNIKKFECKFCGEKFSRSALRHHHYKMVHTEGRPWGCEYCEKSFKMNYNVKLHKKSHRLDDIYKASQGDKVEVPPVPPMQPGVVPVMSQSHPPPGGVAPV
ncbi:hypothetical protein pipiens_001697 [Culex pipiens pipiens]|uniref:Uncharacterized protein n=1 Tax=Culex pipiens pipiens TaxID=38569 RepID=A0ABD1CB27_CULPP